MWNSLPLPWVRHAEAPFGHNIEHECQRALFLLAHCCSLTEHLDLPRIVFAAEECVRDASAQNQLEPLLEALRILIEQRTSTVPAGAATNSPRSSELPRSGVLNTNSATPNKPAAVLVWQRRWVSALRVVGGAAAAAVLTPLSSHDAATAGTPGQPRTGMMGSQDNMQTLTPKKQRSTLSAWSNTITGNIEGGFLVDEQLTSVEVSCCWFAIVVLVRGLALQYLRDMAVLHTQIQFCIQYWQWAVLHPRQALCHHLLSGHKRSWDQLIGRSGGLLGSLRETVLRLRELKAMELFVVQSIGRTYNAMETLISTLDSIAASESPITTGNDGGGGGGGTPGFGTRLHSDVGTEASSTDGERVPPPLVREASTDSFSQELNVSLGHVVRRVLSLVAPKSQSSLAAATSTSMWGMPSAESSHQQQQPHQQAVVQHRMIPQVESIVVLAADDDLHAGTEVNPREEQKQPRHRCGDAPVNSVGTALTAASRVAASAQRWVSEWRDALAAHMSPPVGRHWLRAAAALVIAAPLTKAMLTMSMDDVRERLSMTWRGGAYILQWYVIGPATNLYQSLFAARAGVQERRDALAKEVSSLAQVIRHYHEDYYSEASASELDDIQRRAVAGDYGLVHRHLEQAIRHPIRGFFFGNLVRLALIKVQVLQLDVSRVLSSFDEVLEANDVNFRMMAFGPVILMSIALVSYVALRKKQKLQPAFIKMRLHWRALHRIMTLVSSPLQDKKGKGRRSRRGNESDRSSSSSNRSDGGDSESSADDNDDIFHDEGNQRSRQRHQRHDDIKSGGGEGSRSRRRRGRMLTAASHSSSSSSSFTYLSDESQGRVVLIVHQLRCLGEYLEGYNMTKEFMEDLDDLEAPRCSRQQKLMTLERMMAVHPFLASLSSQGGSS